MIVGGNVKGGKVRGVKKKNVNGKYPEKLQSRGKRTQGMVEAQHNGRVLGGPPKGKRKKNSGHWNSRRSNPETAP